MKTGQYTIQIQKIEDIENLLNNFAEHQENEIEKLAKLDISIEIIESIKELLIINYLNKNITKEN